MFSLFAGVRASVESASWLLLWLLFIAAIINWLHENKKLLEEMKVPKTKRKATHKLLWDWSLIVLSFIAAVSSQWSSETAEEKIRELGTRLEEKLRELTLNDEQRTSLANCLKRAETKGKVWVNFSLMASNPSYGLGQDIWLILKQAEFESEFWYEGDNPAYGIFNPGLVVVVEDPSSIPKHVREITNCLSKVNLAITIRSPDPKVPMNVLNSSNAVIFIHPKF